MIAMRHGAVILAIWGGPLLLALPACDSESVKNGELLKQPSIALASESTASTSAISQASATNLTAMALQSSPGAVCNFHQHGAADRGMRLFPDAQGLVRIFADASLVAASDPKLELDCTSTDGTVLSTQALDPSAAAALERRDTERFLRLPLRPALSGDPMAWTQAELIAAGYPPRPDSAKAPELYANWLNLVGTPARRVSSTVPHPGEERNQTNTIWAGPILNAGTYDWVQGQWNVPAISAGSAPGAAQADAALWVGLDGQFGSSDVVQAGTDSNTWQGASQLWFFHYAAWIEWYPLPMQEISAAVYPGDSVLAEAWVGRSDGTIDATGGYGWYVVQNYTRNWFYSGSVSKPAGTMFAGNTAEWIIERPGVCVPLFGCSALPLANFGSASMSKTRAVATDGHLASPLTDPFAVFNMYTSHNLAIAGAGGTTSNPTAAYLWFNYQ